MILIKKEINDDLLLLSALDTAVAWELIDSSVACVFACRNNSRMLPECLVNVQIAPTDHFFWIWQFFPLNFQKENFGIKQLCLHARPGTACNCLESLFRLDKKKQQQKKQTLPQLYNGTPC